MSWELPCRITHNAVSSSLMVSQTASSKMTFLYKSLFCHTVIFFRFPSKKKKKSREAQWTNSYTAFPLCHMSCSSPRAVPLEGELCSAFSEMGSYMNVSYLSHFPVACYNFGQPFLLFCGSEFPKSVSLIKTGVSMSGSCNLCCISVISGRWEKMSNVIWSF